MNLPPLEPVAVPDPISDADVWAALWDAKGSASIGYKRGRAGRPGTQGVYRAADLYRRYARIARAAGRTPAHPNTLGWRLRALGCVRTRRSVKGFGKVACWIIPDLLGAPPESIKDLPPLPPQAPALPAPAELPADSCGGCGIPLSGSSLALGRCFRCRSSSPG